MIFTEEQKEIQALVHTFAEKEIRPISKKYDELGEFPMELYKKACRMQLNCLDLPAEYGGTGVSKVTSCLIREELSWGDAGFSLSLGANGLGFKPLLIAGTERQRRRFAEVLLNDGFTAFAVTEPDAGSDAGALKTTARRSGDEYILNGHKCFITNGALANIYTVLAVTDAGKGARGLTMFMVDRDSEGLTVGKHEDKMGIRLSNTADVIMHDVRVPAENVIGGEGAGFKIAMETLNQGRAGTCSSAVGIMRAAFEHAMRYAQERCTFGQPIYKNQSIQFMLADMATKIEVSREFGLRVAELIDRGETAEVSKLSSMAKLFSTDTLQSVVTDAVQILGGYGYMRDFPVEKLMRDAKVYQIFEGTNQIQRIVIFNSLLKEQKLSGRRG